MLMVGKWKGKILKKLWFRFRRQIAAVTMDKIPTEMPVLGVCGGGQLGRMMAEAAHNLGVRIAVLDPKGIASPAGQLTRDAFEGDFKDEATVKKFCKESGCKVLTVRVFVFDLRVASGSLIRWHGHCR